MHLPTTRICYVYCATTRELLSTALAPLDPLRGAYLVPPNATLIDPTPETAPPFRRHTFDTSEQGWTLVDDYRGAMIYEKSTAAPVGNSLKLGESLPRTVTTMAPIRLQSGDHCRNCWNEDKQSWELQPDYSEAAIWNKLDGSLAARLAAGRELPAHLTTVAPPAGAGPFVFNSLTGEWEIAPDAPQMPHLDPQTNAESPGSQHSVS